MQQSIRRRSRVVVVGSAQARQRAIAGWKKATKAYAASPPRQVIVTVVEQTREKGESEADKGFGIRGIPKALAPQHPQYSSASAGGCHHTGIPSVEYSVSVRPLRINKGGDVVGSRACRPLDLPWQLRCHRSTSRGTTVCTRTLSHTLSAQGLVCAERRAECARRPIEQELSAGALGAAGARPTF